MPIDVNLRWAGGPPRPGVGLLIQSSCRPESHLRQLLQWRQPPLLGRCRQVSYQRICCSSGERHSTFHHITITFYHHLSICCSLNVKITNLALTRSLWCTFALRADCHHSGPLVSSWLQSGGVGRREGCSGVPLVPHRRHSQLLPRASIHLLPVLLPSHLEHSGCWVRKSVWMHFAFYNKRFLLI